MINFNYCKTISDIITNLFIFMKSIICKKEKIDKYNYFQNERDLEENKFNKPTNNLIHEKTEKKKLISLKNNKYSSSHINKNTDKVLIQYDDGTFGIGTQLFNDNIYYDKKEV